MADKEEPKSGGSKGKSSGRKGGESPTKKKVESPVKKVVESPTKKVPGEGDSQRAAIVVEDVKNSSGDHARPLVETPVTLDEHNVLREEGSESLAEAEGASWSGWFTSTIASAKEKSNEMLQYLKQDLSEFTDTVSEAGRDLKDKLKLEENAKTAVNAVGEKVNVVLEQMSSIFGVGPDDDDEAMFVGNAGSIFVDRIQAKIYSLALDEKVFMTDPEDLYGYEEWLTTFELETKNDEIINLMSANPHLQLHYSQLVPDKVSHRVFWHRFYFQIHVVIEAEARQKQLESSMIPEKASKEETRIHNTESGDHGVVELSEEDQKRLLAEYEEELKNGEESGKHSRRSSGTQMSSSSSGSFAFVTHDPDTNEVKVE